MNRCLTEGRRSFLQRVERIESGAECERLAPLLSAFADGEAGVRDVAVLRPHLRSCLSCRAALRDAREIPASVAAVVPVGLLASVHGASGAGSSLGSSLRAVGGWLQERVLGLAVRGQDVLEAAGSHKIAVAAASAAAIGGGGAVTVHATSSHPDPRSRVTRVEQRPAARPARLMPTAATVTSHSAPRIRHKRKVAEPAPSRKPAQRKVQQPHLAPAQPAPIPRPAPQPAAAAAPSPTPPKAPPPGASSTGEFGP